MKLAPLARRLRRITRRTSGATMIDYVYAMGFIALLSFAALYLFGRDVRDIFTGAGDGLGAISSPVAGNPGNGNGNPGSGNGNGGPVDPNNQPPVIITTNLPLATVGRSFNFQIDATDNEGDPLSFAFASGTLPPGLHVSTIGSIFGVPSTAGTWSFTVAVTDTNRGSTQQTFTIEVNAPPVWSLPQGDALRAQFGNPYSTQLVAIDPDGDSVSYSLFSGSLPGGLTLGADGTLSGTPAAAGFSTFTVAATDSRGATTLQSFSLDSSSAPVWVTPGGALPNAIVGQAYFQQLQATDADHDLLTYELSSGTLQSGLLVTTNGRIMGTPSSGGLRSFSVRVFDGRGNEAFQSFTLRATSAPVWSTAPGELSPAAELGKPYSTQVAATDPDGDTLTYSAVSPLPAGLAINAQSGMISGTPDGAGLQSFTLSAADPFGASTNRTFSIRVSAAPVWATPEGALATGAIGKAYTTKITANDPDGDAISITVASGALPAGLTIDPAGNIAGTPTQAGTFTFTARASDPNNIRAERDFSIEITTAPVWVTATTDLGPGTVGTPYSYQLQATDPDGDALSYFPASADDRLPDGLGLSAGGLISGTPAAGGLKTFNISVSDNKGGIATRLFQIDINSAPVFATAPSLPQHVAGQPYSKAIAVTDAEGDAFTVALTDGSLPAGLSFDPNTRTVSGTPTSDESTTFTLTATDARGASSSRTFAMNRNMPPVWTTPAGALMNAQIGLGYDVALSAVDTEEPVYVLTGGALPAGLSLSGNHIAGTPTVAGESSFTITASDGANAPVARTFSILVNQPPVWQTTSADFPVIKSGVPYSVPLVANDPDGDAVQYTLFTENTPSVLPPGLGIVNGAVAGTPTANVSTNFVIAANDTKGGSATRAFSILAYNDPAAPVNHAPQWAMASETLPTVVRGAPFSLQLLASDDEHDPMTFMVVAGQLPSGLQLDQQSGLISGAPDVSGSYPMTFRVKDIYDNVSGELQLTLVINAPPEWVTPAGALPDGTIGLAYGPVQLQATDADGHALSFVLPNMQVLPPGFTLDPHTGVLAGTPSGGGDFTLVVRVTDTMGSSAERGFTIFVNAPPGFITASDAPPPASIGVPYSFQIRAEDANASQTLTYSIVGGSLPGGLTMSNTGMITGVPTTMSGTFTVRVFDGAGGVAFRDFTIAANSPPSWQQPAGALAVATVGEPYSSQLLAGDPNGDALSYSLSGSDLPAGLTLGANGLISGIPAVGVSTNYEFTVRVADPGGLAATRNFSILTNNKPSWVTAAGALPSENVGNPYSFQFEATDADGHPITFSLAGGTLPPGLVLSAPGILSGTLQQAGDYNFQVKIEDSYLTGSTRAFSMQVRTGAKWETPSGMLTPATVGQAYSFQLQATSPFNGLAYALTSGSLPAGLSLSASGVISGTPTTGGISSFIVTATDAQNFSATRQFTIETNTPPAWQTPSGDLGPLLAANVPMSSIQLSATDADGETVTYALAAGSNLPAGLTLDPTGLVFGTPTNPGSVTVLINATDGKAIVQRSFTLRVNAPPAWQTAAGQLGAYRDGTALSFSVSATDPEGQTVTYALAGGSLPAGLTMNASGLISGTIATVTEDTTSTFMIQATDTMGAASERMFSIFVRHAHSIVFNYTGGNQSFVVPQGVTALDVKLWGAGGGGGVNGWQSGGQAVGLGGGGGFTSGSLTVTPGETLTLIVGGGGGAGTAFNGNCTAPSRGGFGGGGGASSTVGGGGGGRSAIRRSATELATAGGGGGGGSLYSGALPSGQQNGGSGNGARAASGYNGGDASSSAGGAGGPFNATRASAGSAFQGANAAGFVCPAGGGGAGGGGYFGGGSGTSDFGSSANSGGGGGGSGYTGGLSTGSTAAGTGTTAGGNGDGDYSPGIGAGGGPSGAGGNGRIVIVY